MNERKLWPPELQNSTIPVGELRLKKEEKTPPVETFNLQRGDVPGLLSLISPPLDEDFDRKSCSSWDAIWTGITNQNSPLHCMTFSS
jgi:hypothetical protein